MPSAELFGMPLGLVNLVLATWLMAKGFKQPPVSAEDGVPATGA